MNMFFFLLFRVFVFKVVVLVRDGNLRACVCAAARRLSETNFSLFIPPAIMFIEFSSQTKLL